VSLVLSIFSQDILPIFVIAAVGFVLARYVGASVRTLSTVSFHALSPCLVFDQLVTNRVDVTQAWRVVVFCLLLTAAIAIVARLAAIPLRLERTTLSSFLLVVIFSNSGNYALPVVLFAFGRQSLAFASVYFVTSAILVYTVGVFVAASGHGEVRAALRGVTRVPAVWAVVAAVIVLATGIDVPQAIMRPVGMLSDAAIPAMILVLGMQLERHTRPEHPAAVGTAVTLSLCVAPMIAFALAALLGLGGAARQASILEASMPSAVATTVLALQYDLDPSFSTCVVLFSTLLSAFTLVLLIAALQAGW
jgi:predicted permease